MNVSKNNNSNNNNNNKNDNSKDKNKNKNKQIEKDIKMSNLKSQTKKIDIEMKNEKLCFFCFFDQWI